ncbi:MAG: gamma-glutamyltransferase [Polyangiaceae bacterium]|nr:gamma-glutamyltransferase [Polyangiaceae bacterium]
MRFFRAASAVSLAASLMLLLALPGAGCTASTTGSTGPTATAKTPPPAPSPTPPPKDLIPAAPGKTVHKYGVATENATASAIAMDVLARGGSAVDAAIAGALAIGVVHPVSSGIGGGGFAVVWDAKKKEVTVLDFRETAPMGLVPEELMKRPVPEDKRGVMMGTPGEIAGIYEMHARWGKLALAEIFRGPADAAEKGFPVSAHLSRALKWSEKWVTKQPRYGLFAKAGAIVPAGEVVQNPALAATLRKIAAEGKNAFYEGTIAADILATARAGGSRLAASDLKSYQVQERKPLRTQWEGYDIATMPPPSAGGVMMLETLHMHSKADLVSHGFGTGAYAHLLAETFRGAIADRVRKLGDPAFVKVDVEKLTNRDRMKARRAKISMTSTTPAPKIPVDESGTTHIVVVDAEGNVASITSTVNNLFGARLVTEGGFILNDELADFTDERVAKLYGLKDAPNRPRGGARPVSSMTPTIVLKDGKPVMALGGSGGTRIATGTTQVLLAHLAFGMPVQQAVAGPRIETPPTGGLLADVALGVEAIQDLEKRGEVVDTSKPNYSGIQAISIAEGADGARIIEAGADPRKGGVGSVE